MQEECESQQEERHVCALSHTNTCGPHRRRQIRDGAVEVVGLAGQQDQVEPPGLAQTVGRHGGRIGQVQIAERGALGWTPPDGIGVPEWRCCDTTAGGVHGRG